MEQGIKGRTVYHMNGKSLAEWLELKGALSPQQAFSWLEPAVRQLAREHEEGRVHGSISPEAVMVYERLWYCFPLPEKRRKCFAHGSGESREGWCRLTEDQSRREDDDSAGVSGSSWEALEIKLGREEAGPWSDVYSICAVIYTAITGRPPESAAERVNGTELRPPSRLGIRIDEGREAALMKGLALLRKDRWQDAGELYRAFYENGDMVKKKEREEDSSWQDQKENSEKEREQRTGGNKEGTDTEKNKMIARVAAVGLVISLAAVVAVFFLREGAGGRYFDEGEELLRETVSEAEEEETVPGRSNVLMSDSNDTTHLKVRMLGTGIDCDEVISVTFLDSLAERPEEYWDVSADENESVLMWAEENGDGYDLYIGAEGAVIGNPDSSMLFSGCENLQRIDFRGCFDTSQVTDMSYMFQDCVSLGTLDISGLDTSRATDMSYMFQDCASLETLDISSLDTSQVTDMSSMFQDCTSLTEVNISGLETSRVTDMSRMFSGCENLTGLEASGMDTAQAADMSWMFSGCAGLAELDVSGFDTSQATDMSGMFSDCAGLTELDVSGFDTSQVTDMTSMFSGCAGLTALDVTGFDTSRVTDMSWMFFQCGSLTELDISGFDMSNVEYSGAMLEGTIWE